PPEPAGWLRATHLMPVIRVTDAARFGAQGRRVHTAAPERAALASKRHLSGVVLWLLVLAAISVAGRMSGGGHEFQALQRTPSYLRVAILEWLLFAFVIFGIRRQGN